MDREGGRVRAAWVAGLVSLVLLTAASSARAVFPGRNGLLVVQSAIGNGLILVGSDGAHPRRICGPKTQCAGAGGPVWSPDGSEIVAQGSRTYVVYPDGSCFTCAGAGPLGDFWESSQRPAFLPDGRLAVSVDGQFGAMNTDGIGFDPFNVYGDWQQPAWSATGRLAAVRSVKRKREVFVIDPVTGSARRLTGDGTSSPSWSPDGRRLAVVHRGWVGLIASGGGRPRWLTRGRAPVWSPDGKELAFLGARQRLFVIAARGGRPRPVGHIRAQSVDWQPVAGTPTSNCKAPAGSMVLTTSGDATLSIDDAAPSPTGDSAATVLGCMTSDGRERVLEGFPAGGPSAFFGVGATAVAGDYAAVVNGALSNQPFYSFTVAVFDLRTGAAVANRGGETVVCGGCDGGAGLDQLVLGADGVTAAHTFVTNSNYPATSYSTVEQIVANDSTGTHILDTITTTGPNTPTPSSLTDLALSGDTLTWNHAGNPRSAQLNP